ncbi:MAG TPA: SGNH/GDSL hydrolase family protein, partial [Actinomycetota bacterium]
MRRAVSVIAVTVVALALLAAPAAAAPPSPPSSIASLGDSITRAFDVCCFYGDHPSNSWATGSSGLDGIQSHYE